MNKYLTKIASDIELARAFHKDEQGDVAKYTKALKEATTPELKAAIKYALPQEKVHAANFGKVLQKIAEMTNALPSVQDLAGNPARNSLSSSQVTSDSWKILAKDPSEKQKVLKGSVNVPTPDYPAKGIKNTNQNPYLMNNDFETTR